MLKLTRCPNEYKRMQNQRSINDAYTDSSFNSQHKVGINVNYVPSLSTIWARIYAVPDMIPEITNIISGKQMTLDPRIKEFELITVDPNVKFGCTYLEKKGVDELIAFLPKDSGHSSWVIYNDCQSYTNKINVTTDCLVEFIPGHQKRSSPEYKENFGFVDKLSRKLLRKLMKELVKNGLE